MKRWIGALVALCLLAALPASFAEIIGLPNPMREVQNEQAIEQETGVFVILPDDAADMRYFVYDGGLAEVQFTWRGIACLARSMKTDAVEDISGDYNTFAVETTLQGVDFPFTLRYNEGGRGLATWYNDFLGTSHAATLESDASEELLKELFEGCIPRG